MTTGTETRVDSRDPLLTLRKYRPLAPWNLRDLVALAGAALFSSSTRPINSAAAQLPAERTVRFYVTRGLVSAPDGKGTSATYHYRHFLQVLFVKLRQMEGATLATIKTELAELSGDVLERRVASAIGSGLPDPARLPLTPGGVEPRGRSGRVFKTLLQPDPADAGAAEPHNWVRLEISPGVELHMRDDNPYLLEAGDTRAISEAVRLALSRVISSQD